jgi:hypothetical protein
MERKFSAKVMYKYQRNNYLNLPLQILTTIVLTFSLELEATNRAELMHNPGY